MLLMALLFFSLPLIEFLLRNRPTEIAGPISETLDGEPALYFPADRLGMYAGAVGYTWMAALLVCLNFVSRSRPDEIAWIWVAPAAFFFSFTVFAIAGRFVEDGVYLTAEKVIIRARGLRAEIPWESIAGSRTYMTWPFPFERIAIDLHPGSPREVSVTVPWWIGSPRPRRNTVFLTKVQVPGLMMGWEETNPGTWIDIFAQHPPTRQYFDSLSDPPDFRDARSRLWEHLGPPFDA